MRKVIIPGPAPCGVMRHLALLASLLLMTAGCIDLDRGDEPNQEPLAKAKTETAGPYEPETEIWFTGSGSSDPDGDGLDFFWDFDAADGDSQRIVGQGDNGRAAHTYHEEGSYSVTLTVRDPDGAEDTATLQVTIARQTDELRAVVSTEDETEAVYHPGQSLRYDLSATGSTADGDITEYEWDFSYEDDDGFQTERSSNGPETEQDFESGVFVISVRITDTLGEQDEAHGSDGLELVINFNTTITESLAGGTDEGQHDLPVNDVGYYSSGELRYIRLRLEYDTDSRHDLDLYLLNLTGEEVANNNTHDQDNNHQVNSIALEYYNSSHSQWFDEEGELGDWSVEVRRSNWDLGGEVEYKLYLDIIYWEE